MEPAPHNNKTVLCPTCIRVYPTPVGTANIMSSSSQNIVEESSMERSPGCLVRSFTPSQNRRNAKSSKDTSCRITSTCASRSLRNVPWLQSSDFSKGRVPSPSHGSFPAKRKTTPESTSGHEATPSQPSDSNWKKSKPIFEIRVIKMPDNKEASNSLRGLQVDDRL